jgi:hypothetical protein
MEVETVTSQKVVAPEPAGLKRSRTKKQVVSSSSSNQPASTGKVSHKSFASKDVSIQSRLAFLEKKVERMVSDIAENTISINNLYESADVTYTFEDDESVDEVESGNEGVSSKKSGSKKRKRSKVVELLENGEPAPKKPKTPLQDENGNILFYKIKEGFVTAKPEDVFIKNTFVRKNKELWRAEGGKGDAPYLIGDDGLQIVKGISVNYIKGTSGALGEDGLAISDGSCCRFITVEQAEHLSKVWGVKGYDTCRPPKLSQKALKALESAKSAAEASESAANATASESEAVATSAGEEEEESKVVEEGQNA